MNLLTFPKKNQSPKKKKKSHGSMFEWHGRVHRPNRHLRFCISSDAYRREEGLGNKKGGEDIFHRSEVVHERAS